MGNFIRKHDFDINHQVAEWFRWTLDADKRSWKRLCPPVQPAAVWGIRLWCQWASHDVKLSRSKRQNGKSRFCTAGLCSCGSVTEPSGVRSANLRIPYRPRKIQKPSALMWLEVSVAHFIYCRGKGRYAKSTILWGFSGSWHQVSFNSLGSLE